MVTHENNSSEKDSNETDGSACYNCQLTKVPFPTWEHDPGGRPLCHLCNLHYVSFLEFGCSG